jgi:hypothetical protein
MINLAPPRRAPRAPILIALFLALPLAACHHGDANSGSKKGKDWIVLFDGHSSDAWRGFKQVGFPTESWVIDGDALRTVPEHPVDLITRDPFDSFELELEWKVARESNSGIFFHVSEDFPETYWTGPEMQVVDDDNTDDGKNPLTSAGALYDLIAPVNKTYHPFGQWNQVRILVRGQHVEYWLNGGKVVEYELDSPQFEALVAKSKFKDWPKFAKNKTGYIALQNHGGTTWYRNVRVRRLPA